MNRFSIRDIENLTGIKAHTLRIWEQRHGIIKPKRTDTNIRYYDDRDLKLALRVALLNQHGYKISHIQRMTEDEVNRLLRETADAGFQFEYLLNNLIEATVDMDMGKFELLVDKYIRKFGIEQAIESLIFSFLEKVGVMWMTDRIIPAQEHLVSNILSRKILLAIEKLPRKADFTRPGFLLFLPEGEIHELGLLYVQYLLLKYNNHVIYLGANSPLDQVAEVHRVLQPKYLYTHITAVQNDFDVVEYFKKLSIIHPINKIFASGTVVQKNRVSTGNNNIVIFSSLAEAKNILYNVV